MAGQHRRRPRTNPLRADEQELNSLPPKAANDTDTVVPMREIAEMDLSAEAPSPAPTRPSRIQAALRAEMLCRGLRLSQAEFARRYGPASSVVRNWAPRQPQTNGIKL